MEKVIRQGIGIILLIVVSSILISCNNTKKQSIVKEHTVGVYFYTEKDTIKIQSIRLESEKGGLYMIIKDGNQRNHLINNSVINKIEFKTKDSTYLGLPLGFYSNDKITSTFYFPVNDETRKVHIFKRDETELFSIGRSKDSLLLNELIEKENSGADY